MIPGEAVEAAAKAIYSVAPSAVAPADGGFSDELATWDQASDRKKAWDRKFARAALQAAAPYMLAAAWDEGIEAGVDGSVPECDYARNPYRPARG